MRVRSHTLWFLFVPFFWALALSCLWFNLLQFSGIFAWNKIKPKGSLASFLIYNVKSSLQCFSAQRGTLIQYLSQMEHFFHKKSSFKAFKTMQNCLDVKLPYYSSNYFELEISFQDKIKLSWINRFYLSPYFPNFFGYCGKEISSSRSF